MSYKVKLEIFEGPLDLLLYLVKKDHLNIYDIPIAKVTEQYLQYLELMRLLDLNMSFPTSIDIDCIPGAISIVLFSLLP